MNVNSNAVYVPKNAEELRDTWLRDVRLEALALAIPDPPVGPDTDLYIRATANANADLIQYANIALADQSTDILSAEGPALDDKRAAYGLPVVAASPSTGKVIVGILGGGSATLTPATQFVFPNGKRGKIAANTIVSDGQLAPVVAIDTGADTNLPAGAKVRFVATPLNVKTDAVVAPGGLTGGLDDETDDRKKSRLLLALGHLRAGGNWSQKIQVALDALANLQYAFVYPALGGPGSEKVVLMQALDPRHNVWSRQVSPADVAIVQAAMEAAFPPPFEMVVQSVADQPVDVALLLALPDFASNGWINRPVWPALDGDDHVEITVYAGGVGVTLGALTSIAPVDGVTQIAWFSPFDQTFYVRTVTAHSGGSGGWGLTIDSPFIDALGNAAVPGDFVSPAAENLANYAASWVAVMGGTGPGENTTSPAVLPRAARHPTTAEKFPSALTILQLDTFVTANAEIADASYSYRSASSPTIPGALATAPNVLTPRKFGVYSV